MGLMVSVLIIVSYGLMKTVFKAKIIVLLIGIYLLALLLSMPQSIKTSFDAVARINFSDNVTLAQRLKSVTEMGYTTNLVRFNLWKESLEIIKDYPMFGCGLNTYSKVARDYKSFISGGGYPHNSFLQRVAETGWQGLVSFFLVLFCFFITCLRHIFLYENKNNILIVGLLAGIVSFLIQSFFDNNLYALQLVVLFWFMLGLTMAVINLERTASQ